MGSKAIKQEVDELRRDILRTALEVEHFKSKVEATLKMQEDLMKQIIHLLHTQKGDEEEVQMPLTQWSINNNCDSSTPISPAADFYYDPLISCPQQWSSTTTFVQTNVVTNTIPYGINHETNNEEQEYMKLLDVLIQGRPLPQRGQFVKAVAAAGPTLEELMNLDGSGPVSVPVLVPSWRNPPPGLQGEMVHVPPAPPPQGAYGSQFTCKKQRLQ